ncbi:MAG: type VI secretion system tip protein VgrG [Phycisphaerales bacterium]|nr:MAG: type VI secretion system tip protein VgrG [Phycisphaerales bacterium]
MADKPTQKNRELAIYTPLGEDVLLLISMSGTEQLGQPFEYLLELASDDHQIHAKDVVGQNVTIRLELGAGRTRYFDGHVSRFTQLTTTGQLARYQATVVPWLWFLSRTANCRIFQDKKVPDIIKQVFRDRGFTNFEDGLSGSYRTWEYCVQYRETDFRFVSRLMEQEGIYYYFKHENGKHSLVLADSYSAHDPYPEFEELTYEPADKGTAAEECISDWVVETRLQPGSYALKDFDFKNPKKDLLSRARISRQHTAADFEVYDYPGDYAETSDGEEYARKRIEELQAEYEVATAQSDARGICAGFTFSLTGHPRDDRNKEYLITSVNYRIKGDEIFSANSGGGECAYSCKLTSIESSQPFRSPRVAPRPSIAGPQTAVVVGPSGEEVYTDEHARVKVKFHWDRYSKADENSSCWIRVAQVWAGKTWGAMYIPRIGQEVIVEFLEGDPDRPIITGRVYNAQAKPPYDLPGNKTISTLKSSSSKGGEGFNEIRFEDKKGEEQIYVHAEKNLDIRAKNDRFETISRNRHLHVEQDKFEHVDNNRSEEVDADHKETIGKDRHLTVKGKEAKEVAKSLSLTVKGDVIEVFKADHSEQTTKDYYVKAQNVVIEGLQNITLSVGGSYIAIEAGTIEINTSGQLKIDGTQVQVNGKAQTSIQGGAMTEVKGGIVKIN